MSYILDALRRADAEREREAGGVPTLQSQARPALPDDDDRPPTVARPAWLLPAAGGALLALAAAWLLLRGGDAAPPPAPVVAAPPLPRAEPVAVAPAPAPAAAPPAGPPVVVRTPPQQPQQPPQPRPAPAVAAVPKPAVIAAAPAQAAATPAPMPLRIDRRATALPADVGPPGAGASLPERIPRLAELPDTLRRELPALAIGGSVHSPDPGARMVILNGQVRREGDAVGNGLVLKRIRASSAVFEYRGQLFEMPF